MIKKIIDKWKLNRNLLAAKIGMSKGSFNNKLSETGTYKFSEQEQEKLLKVLLELHNDLEKLMLKNSLIGKK